MTMRPSQARTKPFTSMEESRKLQRKLRDENKRLAAQLLTTEEDLSGLVNKNYELLSRLQEESEMKFETYKKSKVLGEHLKVLLGENTTLRKKLAEEEAARRKHENRVVELQRESEGYQRQVEELMGHMEGEKCSVSNKDAEISRLQKQIRTLNEQNYVLMRRVQTEMTAKSKAEQEADKHKIEAEQSTSRQQALEEAQQRVHDLTSQLREMQTDYSQVQTSSTQQSEQVALIQQRLRAAEERVETRDELIQDLKSKCARLEEQLEERTRHVHSSKEDHSVTELERKKIQLENEQLRRETERLLRVEDVLKSTQEKASSLSLTCEHLEVKLRDMEAAKKEAEEKRGRDRKQAEEKLRSLLDKLAEVEARAVALESVNGKLTRRLEVAAEKVAECEREKLDLSSSLKRATALNKVIMESLAGGDDDRDGD